MSDKDRDNTSVESTVVAPAERGRTIIEDTVVAKLAGLAAREVTGVHSVVTSGNRIVGALRDSINNIPGANSISSGVNVTVTDGKVTVSLGITADYGVALHELCKVIRSNVISTIEQLTGLSVTEVNLTVFDIYFPQEADSEQAKQ